MSGPPAKRIHRNEATHSAFTPTQSQENVKDEVAEFDDALDALMVCSLIDLLHTRMTDVCDHFVPTG